MADTSATAQNERPATLVSGRPGAAQSHGTQYAHVDAGGLRRLGRDVAVSTQTATLIAAAIAAIAATISLLVTTIATGRRERKAADRAIQRERRDVHRGAVTPHLSSLAGAIHELVATSFVQQKALKEGKTQAAMNWQRRGLTAKDKLEVLRREVRYFLPGLDPGFKALIPLPNWVAHRSGGVEADRMLTSADALARQLHQAIEDSWRTGEPPPDEIRRRTLVLADAVRESAPIGRLASAEPADEDLAEAPTSA